MINNLLTPFVNGSGGQLIRGHVIRLVASGSDTVTKAQATTAAGVLGTVGVVNSGVIANGGNLQAAIFGQAFVLLEAGLTLIAGQTLYVSLLTAGLATNIPPSSNALPIGTIEDASDYTRTSGVIANVSPALVPASSSTVMVADWTLGICRVYALDLVDGDDAFLGYADPTTTGAAAYAVACQLAGTRAKKTFAGLAAILPRFGAFRLMEIVIANGGVNTVGAYTGGLDTFLASVFGFAQGSCVRATGTNTTAGVVKFDGSAADCTYLGGITGTGLNVAGYNPTGAATTTSIPCTMVGGGAPAFPAEPGVPAGLRVRFSSGSETQAALRGVCRFISQRSASDTVIVSGTVLPAVPIPTDIFYVEMAGVTCSAYTLGENGIPTTAITNTAFQFAGIRVTAGTCFIGDGRFAFAFAGWNSMTVVNARRLNLRHSYIHPVRGALVVGGNRAEGTLNLQNVAQLDAAQIGCAVQFFALNCFSMSMPGGSWASTMSLINQQSGTTQTIGTVSAPTGSPPRSIGAGGFNIQASFARISSLAITNAGAVPAVSITGMGGNVLLTSMPLTGSSGNTDVGLDLTKARNYTIYLETTAPPTVTGLLGDVRLAGGQIITWAEALQGVIDLANNSIQSGPTDSVAASAASSRIETKRVPFSGSIIEAAGATTSYLADTGPVAANQTVPLRRPVSAGLCRGMRFTNLVNNATAITTLTLWRAPVATGIPAATTMTASIPAGTAANTKFSDFAHPVYFADGDDYDVRMDDPGGIAGRTVSVAGILEWC